jgi:hypothetical protein
MSETNLMEVVLTLAQGIVNLGDDLRKQRVSLLSLQTTVAALVDPANPKAAFQEILDQDKYAQTLAPSKEIEQVQIMLQALGRSNTPGKA